MNIMRTISEQAIQWWNKLDLGVPHLLTQTYHKGRATSSLTSREIEEIWRKEVKTENNIYLNRLKEQYKTYMESKESSLIGKIQNIKRDYQAMRLFCLDTQLVSFNDIEAMEYEVNQSF